MDVQKIGAFLAELRKERNLTQDEIIYLQWRCCKFFQTNLM